MAVLFRFDFRTGLLLLKGRGSGFHLREIHLHTLKCNLQLQQGNEDGVFLEREKCFRTFLWESDTKPPESLSPEEAGLVTSGHSEY